MSVGYKGIERIIYDVVAWLEVLTEHNDCVESLDGSDDTLSIV